MALYHAPKIVTDGLVFYFDAGNVKCYPKSDCIDIIGSVAGEFVNSPTFTSDVGGAISFTTNQYIKFPNNTALDTQTPSIEIWFRTNNLNQSGFFFEKGNVNSQYSLFQEATTIKWRSYIGALQNMIILDSSNIDIVNWWNISVTFTSGDQQMYLNGEYIDSGTTSGTINTNSGGESIGAYGGYSGSRGYYYDGDISVVRVYNRVLAASEVRNNFNAMRGRFGI